MDDLLTNYVLRSFTYFYAFSIIYDEVLSALTKGLLPAPREEECRVWVSRL